MEKQAELSKDITLESIITNAVKLPLVKVNRDGFLAETFSNEDIPIQEILETGPIKAGISRDKLSNAAKKLILKRTGQSSAASFVAGIPGGLAMAATIPADVMQFFGMALRLAQELSYLYGAQDLWQDGQVDDERIKSQLILYCGVMFGVSGAVSGVRLLSTQIAKTTLKKLPQKALTKTFWYPMVKQIGKAVGVKVTKSTVAKGISKAIPVIGGVISGSLNFASMMPMANRLHDALDKANFNYSDKEMMEDIETIETIAEEPAAEVQDKQDTKKSFQNIKGKITKGVKSAGTGVSDLFAKHRTAHTPSADEIMENIEKLAKLKDAGVITQQEFDDKKTELLSKI